MGPQTNVIIFFHFDIVFVWIIWSYHFLSFCKVFTHWFSPLIWDYERHFRDQWSRWPMGFSLVGDLPWFFHPPLPFNFLIFSRFHHIYFFFKSRDFVFHFPLPPYLFLFPLPPYLFLFSHVCFTLLLRWRTIYFLIDGSSSRKVRWVIWDNQQCHPKIWLCFNWLGADWFHIHIFSSFPVRF